MLIDIAKAEAWKRIARNLYPELILEDDFLLWAYNECALNFIPHEPEDTRGQQVELLQKAFRAGKNYIQVQGMHGPQGLPGVEWG